MDAAELDYNIRKPLRFPEEVLVRFSFLIEWGFKCFHTEPTIVQYMSRKACVNIFLGRRSFEIDAEFQKDLNSTAFGMGEMLRLLSYPEADNYRRYASDTVNGVARGVEILSDIFLKHLTADVFYDKHLFEKLEKQRDVEINSWCKEMKKEHLRLDLENAWKKKDYHTILECAESLKGVELLKSEIAKINYARKTF